MNVYFILQLLGCLDIRCHEMWCLSRLQQKTIMFTIAETNLQVTLAPVFQNNVKAGIEIFLNLFKNK